MKLEFVREDPDKQDATWWASYLGVEKAIGLIYSPAFGHMAVLVVRKPVHVVDGYSNQLHQLILDRNDQTKFMFTPTGFYIEVDEAKLAQCLEKRNDIEPPEITIAD